MTLTLKLAALPFTSVGGTYTVNGYPGMMPDRTRYLHPDAARSYLDDLAEVVTVSDMFRSAESSLAAVRAGRGAKAPGYSGHGYGLSIDLDVPSTMAALGVEIRRDAKHRLDDWMAARGWYCHRADHAMPSWKPKPNEAWHYNYLPGHTWGLPSAAAVESRILELHGNDFMLGAKSQQIALSRLRLYRGAIDGDIGPLSREALRAFQRTWNLPETGKADARTRRTLAYVTAEVELVTG